MLLHLVRHGQTEWNVLKLVQGSQDIRLNEKGIEQANIISGELDDKPIDFIVASPLIRARETAEIINRNRNLPIYFDKRIEERCFGIYEGKSREYIDSFDFWNYYKNDQLTDAECVQDFFGRVYDFLDDVTEAFPDKNILVVSHGGVSIPVHCYFDDFIPDGSLMINDYKLENCQVKTFVKK